MAAERPLVSYLAYKFDLNDCETADLSSWAEALALCAEGKCRGDHAKLSAADVKAHLGIRAEVLALLGSPVQEMYDNLAKHIGDDKMGYEDLMA